jgi:D-3-phosphoglycerate dehydrogenase
MADSSLALLLALMRGVVALDRSVREGKWDHAVAGPLRTNRGTRLAVIGFGRIGRALATRALALGFEVCAVDPQLPDEAISGYGVHPLTLDEALSRCEVFSLHSLLTDETRGMIGAGEIAKMPRGALLVDTARAGLVDFDAVLAALDSGHLAGAAFDVLPVEPPSAVAPAPERPTLIVNPHAAWYSPATEHEAYRRPAVSVREALEGHRPTDALAP